MMLPYLIYTFLLFIIVCYLFFLQKYYLPLYVDRITKIYTNINYYLLILYFIAFLISLIYCFLLYGNILYEKSLVEILNKIDWEKVPHIKEGSSSVPSTFSVASEKNQINPEKNTNIFKDNLFKIESASSERTASQEGQLSKEKSSSLLKEEAQKKENTPFSPKEESKKSMLSNTREWCNENLSLKKMVRKQGFNLLKNEAETLSPANRTMTIQLGGALHSQSYKPEELGFPNLSEKNTGADIPAYFIHTKTPTGEIKSFLCVDTKQCLTKYDDVHNQILGKSKFNFLERAALNVAIQAGDFEGHRCFDLKETTLSNQTIGEYSTNVDQGNSSSTSTNNSQPPESPTASAFNNFN